MKRFFCILLAALLLLTLAACSKAPEAEPADEAPDWQTQYDLGVRYLSEGNYEEAILAFEAAIKIDPKNADAYR
ncbi:MAG: tetratricopeptide repeat protein, partial [Oscillospiraceae bacterium]